MSFKYIFPVLSLALLAYVVQATKVRTCPTFEGKLANESVSISACDGPPCKLRKKSDVIVNIKFKPEKDIEKIITSVNMKLLGIPFPFIGVDGTSACDKLYESDGKTKTKCPLVKGKEYVYQNSFKVLEIYPNVRGVVHWGLHDPAADKDTSCFEILAKII
uniref:Venom protein family 7 protein 1 n=1 Tax=Pristhesancus plagipennis TaxID=1955184 RepID=A0A1Q1NPD3_PRIPG|nr:venom protein family 7 protein 1 [Pristhesancus plagipennis]